MSTAFTIAKIATFAIVLAALMSRGGGAMNTLDIVCFSIAILLAVLVFVLDVVRVRQREHRRMADGYANLYGVRRVKGETDKQLIARATARSRTVGPMLGREKQATDRLLADLGYIRHQRKPGARR